MTDPFTQAALSGLLQNPKALGEGVKEAATGVGGGVSEAARGVGDAAHSWKTGTAKEIEASGTAEAERIKVTGDATVRILETLPADQRAAFLHTHPELFHAVSNKPQPPSLPLTTVLVPGASIAATLAEKFTQPPANSWTETVQSNPTQKQL